MRTPIATLALVAALVPAAAMAQQQCGQRTAITEQLTAKYGEYLAAGGLQSAQSIVEIWFSEEKGTWTILMTRPNGTSCLLASGTDWRNMPKPAEVAGIPG